MFEMNLLSQIFFSLLIISHRSRSYSAMSTSAQTVVSNQSAIPDAPLQHTAVPTIATVIQTLTADTREKIHLISTCNLSVQVYDVNVLGNDVLKSSDLHVICCTCFRADIPNSDIVRATDHNLISAYLDTQRLSTTTDVMVETIQEENTEKEAFLNIMNNSAESRRTIYENITITEYTGYRLEETKVDLSSIIKTYTYDAVENSSSVSNSLSNTTSNLRQAISPYVLSSLITRIVSSDLLVEFRIKDLILFFIFIFTIILLSLMKILTNLLNELLCHNVSKFMFNFRQLCENKVRKKIEEILPANVKSRNSSLNFYYAISNLMSFGLSAQKSNLTQKCLLLILSFACLGSTVHAADLRTLPTETQRISSLTVSKMALEKQAGVWKKIDNNGTFFDHAEHGYIETKSSSKLSKHAGHEIKLLVQTDKNSAVGVKSSLGLGHVPPVRETEVLPSVSNLAQRKPRSSDIDGMKSETHEYCSFEYFNVTCQQNEVILIQSARYGRMKLGRCVKVDLGYLGCAADVSRQLDTRCTGRRQCVIKVDDNLLRLTNPCPSDVTWYLEVKYSCVRVLTREGAACRAEALASPLPPRGYIASIVSLESHYGQDNKCPWIITVKEGQRIKLSLVGYYSFTSDITSPATGRRGSGALYPSDLIGGDEYRQPRLTDVCVELGSVVEDDKRTGLVVCGEDLEGRDRLLYTSQAERVTLALNTATTKDIFLLHYEASGCPAVTVPQGGWTVRAEDRLTVRCNNSDDTWQLVCRGEDWIGTIGNCSISYGKQNEFQQNQTSQASALPLSILIAVAVGVALGIFIGGVLLAVVGSRINKTRKCRTFQDADPHLASRDGCLYSSDTLLPPGTDPCGTNTTKCASAVQYLDSMDLGALRTVPHYTQGTPCEYQSRCDMQPFLTRTLCGIREPSPCYRPPHQVQIMHQQSGAGPMIKMPISPPQTPSSPSIEQLNYDLP